MKPKLRAAAFAAVVILSIASCGGRDSSEYLSFVASHDALRPGMSIRQVFEAGLADYLIQIGGKNVPGSTVAGTEPVSADCRRHVFSPADRQVTPQGSFVTKSDFLQGLDGYSSWARSMSFRVESPALKVGGVYDHYTFSTDESGKIATVSLIEKSTN